MATCCDEAREDYRVKKYKCARPENADDVPESTPGKYFFTGRRTGEKERKGEERQQNGLLVHLERKEEKRYRGRQQRVREQRQSWGRCL